MSKVDATVCLSQEDPRTTGWVQYPGDGRAFPWEDLIENEINDVPGGVIGSVFRLRLFEKLFVDRANKFRWND
jgi:hypothetical protein